MFWCGSYLMIFIPMSWLYSGGKVYTPGKKYGQTGNTSAAPLIAPNATARPTAAAAAAAVTWYPDDSGADVYSPGVQRSSAPVSSERQESAAGGYGDLGEQSIAASATRSRAAGERPTGTPSAADHRSLSSTLSSASTAQFSASVGMRADQRARRSPPTTMPVFSLDHPGTGAAVARQSTSMTTTAAPSLVNGGREPIDCLAVHDHNSLI